MRASSGTGLDGDGLPFVKLSSEIFRAELGLLREDEVPTTSPSRDVEPLSQQEKRYEEEDRLLLLVGESPAYPAAMKGTPILLKPAWSMNLSTRTRSLLVFV